MAVAFRAVALDEMDTLLTLIREYYDYDGHDFDEQKSRRALGELLANDAYGCVWFILDGETVIGYMVVCFGFSLEFGGRDAFIDELYVREAYRGQGIGTQAIGYMLDACRVKGIRALHLEVMPDNHKALRLYERIGFENRGSSLMSIYTAPTA